MGKVLTMNKAREQRLYRGLDALEEAIAGLHEAAKYLEPVGLTAQAQACKVLHDLSVELRRELPHGLGPAA